MKIFLILLFVTALSLSVTAGNKECSSCTVYRGYISGDMGTWKKGMEEMQTAYDRSRDPCVLFTITEAKYGYVGYMLTSGKKGNVRPLVDELEEDVEKLSAFSQYNAETEAFRVALLGFRMVLNPSKSVSLGPKAVKQLEKAMETGGSCPEVWIEKANSESHMPAFAGGSKTKAAESFTTALRLFEAKADHPKCNWRYLNTMVMLGQLLEKMDDTKGAREVYLKALKIEPDFQWVRDELLPAVEKKMK